MQTTSQHASAISLFKLFAQYNQLMNQRILQTCSTLSENDLMADMGAFFGSIMGTLNHLVNADELWLSRLLNRPHQVHALNAIRFANLQALREVRSALDEDLIGYIDRLDDNRLDKPLKYTSLAASQTQEVPLNKVLLHLFNHQTHHRG